MLTLRGYQQRIIKAAQASLVNNRHTGIYASQGAGKSVLAAFMAESAELKGFNVLLLSHRIEILKQNFSKMEALNLSVQLLHAGRKLPEASGIVVAMSQTIAARLRHPRSSEQYSEWLSKFDFIIVDEAHRAEHDCLFQHFNSKAWVVGMSGTWLRYGNQEQLSKFYSNIVAPVMPSEIIEMGFILPSANYFFDAPKLDDVEVYSATGDYNQIKLQSKFAKSERYLGIVENYQRICPGKKALVFTTGAKHCVDLTKSFCEAGIRAKYLLSVSTDKCDFNAYSGKREDVLGWLKRGEIEVVVSVEMLSTGFDEPSLECVILDFSTKSYTKYQQAVARADRPYPGQDKFYVLDFGNNIKKPGGFGKFEDDPIISLFHKTGDGGVPPTKMCPTDRPDQSGLKGCGRLIPVSVMKCPFCGYQWLTEKEEYHVELQLMVDEVDYANETIKQYCARKKLAGWDNKWILRDICKRNPDNQKKAFMEAIKVLRGDNGELISPGYWWVFRKLILKQK
jgi:superfamily II DNA or RNA helicase